MAGVEKPGGDVPAGVPVPPPEGLHLVVLGGGGGGGSPPAAAVGPGGGRQC